MAHITVRPRQTKAGLKWTATLADWDHAKGYSVERALTPTVLKDLGFSENMTPGQAKDHAKRLNALDKAKRKENKSKVRASERLHDLVIVENSIVPTGMSELFLDYIEKEWAGGAYNLRKQAQHWGLVQRMITSLKIQPHEYVDRKNEFYRYFEQHRMGKSYVQKVLKVLNQWGKFYSRQTKTYFEKVPAPSGQWLQKIKANALRATGEGAAPITPAILKHMRLRLPEAKYNYSHATLWFGFRPVELDPIIDDLDANLQIETQGETTIVGIYQGKLTAIDERLRWRWVPCIHPEQKVALDNILGRKVKKTTVKTMRKYAPPDAGDIGQYSGRKGFTDLFLEMGQSLEDISQWMGHADISRTWKHYKNKRKVHFKPIAKLV